MRVICIDENAWPSGYNGKKDENGIIRNGGEYNVIDAYVSGGFLWFVISEDDPNFGYWENCFSRTSEIDETTFEREYLKEKV